MDDNAQHAKVSVSKEEAIELKEKYTGFEKQFAEAQANFQNSTFATYYLVSKKFLDSWREFCMSGDTDRVPPPPMNIDLIDPATQKLRSELV